MTITELIKAGKEIAGVKDPKKLVPATLSPLKIMKTVYYCMETVSFTYWMGSHQYNQGLVKTELAPYKLLLDEDQIKKMADSNEYLRIYNSLTIKYYGNFPCLILDTSSLYGVAEQIMECGTKNVYYDLTTGDSITIQVVAQEVAVKQAEEIKDEVIITEAPEEVIAILFDTSGSMQEEYAEGVEKMRAAKSFFYTFADRALGFNLKAVISLILFSGEIKVKCQFTERFRSFKRHVELINPEGCTRMYDAMLLACDNLAAFAGEYPRAIKRCIVFSDGEDTGSQKSAFEAATGLRKNNILVDSVVVGTKNQELKAISQSTGGYSYFFSGLEEGIQLFENETFVKSTLRKKEPIPLLNTPDDLEMLKKRPYANAPPEIIVNPHLASKVVDPTKYLYYVIYYIELWRKLSQSKQVLQSFLEGLR